MESLRLCHPLGSSSKLTNNATILSVAGKAHIIPPNSNVQVNFCGLHANTHIWGESALAWDPARFIESGTEKNEKDMESEQLRTFQDGAYIPWSHGERVCPGKRFSQVELAAVLAVLFRKHYVEPVPEVGELPADARKRAQQVSLDIQMTLLNEMYQPERLGLRWVEAN